MRHFLFEFITGGGLAGQPLSESLLREGKLMLETLTNELSELNVELFVSRDSRLGRLNNHIKQFMVDGDIDIKLEQYIKDVDVCWLIAPETGQCMQNYADLFSRNDILFIGSTVEAIRICSSKYLTNKLLSENNIDIIKTSKINEKIVDSDTGWVIKPDDGAGAEDTQIILDKEKLDLFINNNLSNNFIIQPYIKGNHMSMSLLVYDGEVSLLGCNQLYVDMNENTIKLERIVVNENLAYKNEMLKLAKKIVSVISGLAGYIGIDLIEQNGKLNVLEINPRLTTAYVGLSKSIGCNVASKILNTFINKKLPDINMDSVKPVTVYI